MKTKNLYLIFLIFLFFSCSQQKKETIKNETAQDSVSVIKKAFENSPNIIEYEISVLKGTNIKHGIQKRYYQHGSLYSEIPYLNGKKKWCSHNVLSGGN